MGSTPWSPTVYATAASTAAYEPRTLSWPSVETTVRILERPSPNHDARPDGQVVDMLVLHYTGMTDAAAALDRLCDPAAQVSAHYLIDEDGTEFRLEVSASTGEGLGLRHQSG